jgi:ribosome biogenesis protein SSF1/2
MKDMVKNLREVMYPYTGMKLNDSEKIRIKDYIKGCGVYGVSHMMILSSTERYNYLKIVKSPHGPTLTFRIENYALIEDVLNS